MKKLKSFILSLVLVACLTGVSLADNIINYADITKERIGAICCDNTKSKATGRGACSWHGGVKYWLYDDGTKESTGRCD